MGAAVFEGVEKRRNIWRQEAADKWESELGPFQKLRLFMGGRIYVRDEQLMPGNADNPETPLYLFYCPIDKIPDIDYEHGYVARLDCSLCSAKQSGQPAAPPSSPAEPLAA